jgi:hypothetical protein
MDHFAGFDQLLRVILNVWRNKVEAMGLSIGPWLETFKEATLHGAPEDTLIEVAWRTVSPLTTRQRPRGIKSLGSGKDFSQCMQQHKIISTSKPSHPSENAPGAVAGVVGIGWRSLPVAQPTDSSVGAPERRRRHDKSRVIKFQHDPRRRQAPGLQGIGHAHMTSSCRCGVNSTFQKIRDVFYLES